MCRCWQLRWQNTFQLHSLYNCFFRTNLDIDQHHMGSRSQILRVLRTFRRHSLHNCFGLANFDMFLLDISNIDLYICIHQVHMYQSIRLHCWLLDLTWWNHLHMRHRHRLMFDLSNENTYPFHSSNTRHSKFVICQKNICLQDNMYNPYLHLGALCTCLRDNLNTHSVLTTQIYQPHIEHTH